MSLSKASGFCIVADGCKNYLASGKFHRSAAASQTRDSATGLSSLGERIKDAAEFAIFVRKCQEPRCSAGFKAIRMAME
jgi:hypothetical protein